MADRIYCYPDSDVLMNKLNIRNLERLHEAGRKLTMLRLNDLLEVSMTKISTISSFRIYMPGQAR